MIKLLLSFAIFAGIVYYYNIDLISLVEKSGAPKWLSERGYTTKSGIVASTTSSNSATTIAP